MQRDELIKKITREAGIMFKNMQPGDVRHKNGNLHDLVTEADVKTQEFVIAEIKKFFPNDLIIGEEGDMDYPDLKDVEKAWVIDPIDGTNNYSFGRNLSSACVGYLENGIAKIGAVYNPYADEFFYAEKGSGAFLNNVSIKVSNQTNLSKATFEVASSNDPKKTRLNLEKVMKVDPMPWVLVRVSAGISVCEVAMGRADLYFTHFVDKYSSPAAFLILREAGGAVKNLEGEDAYYNDSSCFCGNEELVNKFLEVTK
jgi:myo-inositol-1(or 4)-monophosphatase